MNAGRWILIAANPKSGAGPSGTLVRALADALTVRDFEVEVVRSLELLKSRADQLHHQRLLNCIVCAGGDGTVSVVANLISAEIPLLIFPLGTENLLAKHWGLSRDIETTCTTLMGNRIVHMDVGTANGKLFMVMLGCGFDAEVVRQMDLRRTGHITRFSYTVPILRSLWQYSFPQLDWTATCGGQSCVGKSAWIFVVNVPRYGANLSFFPQADVTDGKLDLCTFKRSGIINGLSYLLSVWRGSHLKMSDFEHNPVRRLTVEAPRDQHGNEIQVPYQLDGDLGGKLPLEVEVLPARLKLVVPAATAASDPLPVMPLSVSSA